MIIDSAEVFCEEVNVCKDQAYRLLRDYQMEDAFKVDIMNTNAELVFANGNVIASLKNRGHIFSGIEIALPSMGYLDVIDKTQLGLKGALYITEQVLNGILF
jgi:hypothetical protein